MAAATSRSARPDTSISGDSAPDFVDEPLGRLEAVAEAHDRPSLVQHMVAGHQAAPAIAQRGRDACVRRLRIVGQRHPGRRIDIGVVHVLAVPLCEQPSVASAMI